MQSIVPTVVCPPGAGSMRELIALHTGEIQNQTVGYKRMAPHSLAGPSGMDHELKAEGRGPDEKGQLCPS